MLQTNQRSVWEPSPQQLKLILCPIEDVFFGGARGGGKTDGLLGNILVKAQRYGSAYRSLFVRRTLKELEDVQRRSREIFGKVGWNWAESKTQWTAPNGAICYMKYLDVDEDAERYQGWNLSNVSIDEAGAFASPDPINKLWGALRSVEGIPVEMRLSGNPGGPGHFWLKKRYIDHGTYVPRRWQPQPEYAPDLWVNSAFIPSRIEDNPFLMANDPMYKTRLAMVGDQKLFRAWVDGDWDALSGAYFDWDPAKHVREMPPMEGHMTRWMAMDWGYSHPSVILWGCWDGQTAWVYRELSMAGYDPARLAEAIADANGDDRLDKFYLSPDAFANRQSERSIAMEIGDVFRKRNDRMGEELLPYPTPADNDRVNGWQLVAQGLREGRLVITPACRLVTEFMPVAQRDPKKPNDILKVDGDDAGDTLRYLWASRQRDPMEPADVRRARILSKITDPNVAAMRARMMEAEDRQASMPVAFGRRAFPVFSR